MYKQRSKKPAIIREVPESELPKKAKKHKVKPAKEKKPINIKELLLYAVLGLVLVVGIGLLSYPTVSNWYNQRHQSRAISGYTQQVSTLPDADKLEILEEARKYNANLSSNSRRYFPEEEDMEEYNKLLDPSGNSIMGYIDIPKIDVHLAIYHGTSDAVLQTGVGHIVGSSLPVGGSGTHALLSGHRGLPSSLLFTHLDRMAIGDTFSIHVLGDVLTYQVDDIQTVLPTELNNIKLLPGQDYVTLVTCTPYGVNSHRLLVRGTRIDTPQEDLDAEGQIEDVVGVIHIGDIDISIWVPLLGAAAILLFLLELLRRRIQKGNE